MSVQALHGSGTAGYHGLRMSAAEFLDLPENPVRYELIDGVVVMSPSPSFWHQDIIAEILFQIRAFLDRHPIGKVVSEVDIQFGDDLVYRPDLVFLSAAKAARVRDRVTEIPDLVVEIVSPDSRSYDSQTKHHDYEAAGITEYWLIDPIRKTMQFFVLSGGAYREAKCSASRYASTVLSGFELDLDRVRRLF